MANNKMMSIEEILQKLKNDPQFRQEAIEKVKKSIFRLNVVVYKK